MVDDVVSKNPFKLLWSSRDEAVSFEYGKYASIPEASDDLPAAEAARRTAQHPHEIDGTWRTVPNEPPRAIRRPRVSS